MITLFSREQLERKQKVLKNLERRNPFDSDFSAYGIFLKFLLSFISGLFVNGALVMIVGLDFLIEYGYEEFIAMMIAIPLTSGIMGIFCFNKMLDLCKNVTESIIGLPKNKG